MGYRKGLNGAWKNPFIIQSLPDEIAWSSVIAGILHIIWVCMWTRLKGKVDYQSAIALLVAPSNGLLAEAIKSTSENAGEVVIYFSTLILVSYLLGVICHWIIRKRGLDHRFKVFRFDNPWFYCLSGEFISPLPPERWFQWRPIWWTSGEKRQADVVQVSAVVKQGGNLYIYTGRLVDYEFNRKGELDRIVLSETSRRELSKDKNPKTVMANGSNESSRFYPIESLYFVISYLDICTLNITYHIWESQETESSHHTATKSGSYNWLNILKRIMRRRRVKNFVN